MIRAALARFAFLFVLAGAANAQAQIEFSNDGEPAFLVGGVGAAGAFDEEQEAYFRLELRAAEKFYFLRPFVGVEASAVGNTYLLAGLATDIFIGRRFVLTPNAAFGWFRDVDELDLGYGLQFRTGFELAYRFDDRSRLGLTFHHISNANLGDRNPGTEVAMIQYALPLHRLLP